MKKNTFNIIHIADIHFGKKNDKKLYNDLKNNFLDNIPIINKEYPIGMVVIEGDLFDRVIKMSELSSNYVIKFIEELCQLSDKYKFYLRLIKGTKGHDYNQLLNFLPLTIRYPLFKIISSVEKEEIKYKDYFYEILYLPEEYPENYKEYYKDFINKKVKYDFIFGHGMIDAVSFTGDEETKRKIKRNEAVHSLETLNSICNYYTVFGHIHDMKSFSDDTVLYVGSFERFSFADQEDKGFLLTSVDPETDAMDAIFYENPDASTYHIEDLSNYEFNNTEEKIKFIEELKSEYDYVKIILNEKEDNKELLKNVISSDVKIQMNNKIEDDVVDERFRFILNRELPLNESISKYINLVYNKNISPTKINEFITKSDNV